MPGFPWRREKSLSMPRARKYSRELLDRGARLVFESGRPFAHVARDLGVEGETLRKHVRQVEADEGRGKDASARDWRAAGLSRPRHSLGWQSASASMTKRSPLRRRSPVSLRTTFDSTATGPVPPAFARRSGSLPNGPEATAARRGCCVKGAARCRDRSGGQ
jgi:transposase-like protein